MVLLHLINFVLAFNLSVFLLLRCNDFYLRDPVKTTNVFCTGASFYLSYTVLKGNSGVYKNKHTLPRCIDRRDALRLGSRKMEAQSTINWTVVSQLS